MSLTSRFKSWLKGNQAGPVGDPLDYDKVIHLDAEELAEQGILEAYNRLRSVLAEYTDPLLDLTEEVDGDAVDYRVSIGQSKYVIWDADARNKDGWERATVCFFSLVNQQLQNSPYKLYALYGGNDLSGIFLTEAEFKEARSAIPNRASWPWLPVDEPPNYGYPASGAA